MKIIFLEEFGKAFIPKKIRPRLRNYMLKAGIDEVPYKSFGALFYLSLFVTYFIYITWIFPWLDKNFASIPLIIWTFFLWVLIQMAFAGLIMFAVYSYLDIVIYNRTKTMEEVVPEFLKYVSENLRGGMSFDKALWSSIRPEFGVLSDEIQLLAKKVMSGYGVDEAIEEFTNKYDSPTIKRSFGLIVEGMKGGAPLADLIERIHTDLTDTMDLKSEMSATNTTYVIFLTVIIMFISPALFGLSYNLLLVFRSIAGTLGGAMGHASNLPFQMGDMKIDADGFRNFSVVALCIISIFSSMIISIIRKGNIKQGLKYIPLYTIVAIVMYFIFRAMFTGFFSGLINIA